MDYFKNFGGVSSSLFFKKRPSWSDLSFGDKLFSSILIVRGTFMVGNGLIFILKSIQVGLLYKKTYKRCLQFETIFLTITAIKICILIPDIFIYNINWIYYALAMNSALAYTLSYELRRRTTILQEMKGCAVKCSLWWYIARMIFLCFILVSPMIDLLETNNNKKHLTCTKFTYRKCINAFNHFIAYNFLFIFLLDFLSALVDLIHLIKMPKFMSKRKRVKLMKSSMQTYSAI